MKPTEEEIQQVIADRVQVSLMKSIGGDISAEVMAKMVRAHVHASNGDMETARELAMQEILKGCKSMALKPELNGRDIMVMLCAIGTWSLFIDIPDNWLAIFKRGLN